MLASIVSLVFFTPLIADAQIIGNEATCKMAALSMEASPTTIDTKTSVKFHAKVDRKGCAQGMDINFEFYTNPDGYNRKTWTCIKKPPHSDIIEFDCAYNFSQYQFWSSVTLPGTLPYYMMVYSPQGHLYADTSSWGKKFSVVKGVLGEGFVYIVDPPQPTMGASFTVKYVDFPPGATGKIFVNDENHFVNIFSGGNSIAVNTQNGFKVGSNSIRVVLYNSSGTKFYDNPFTFTLAAAGNPPSNVGIGDPARNVGIGNPPRTEPPDSKLNEFLFNPLPTDSLTGALLTVAKGFLGIIALWAITFIIIGAFKLIMAQGHEEDYVTAKKTITWAVLGLIVAMLSFSIIAIVQNILQIKVPSPPKENSSKGDNPVENKTP